MTQIKQSRIYWKVFDAINSCRHPCHFNGVDRLISFATNVLPPEKIDQLKQRRRVMFNAVEEVYSIINT